MRYAAVGRSGLKVSRVALGSWLTMGRTVDHAASTELVHAAFEHGVNFFDTADVYGNGAAEEALAPAISGLRRESLVIASKCFFPMSDDVNDRGLSRKHVFESLHGSLRRLGIDYLDLYQCHRPDPETPVEETALAMADLIRQGKVLYWGVSYWPAHRIVEAVAFCRQHALPVPISNQPPYNLLHRAIEDEVMPVCRAHGLGQVVFSPLAQGVLTGKYRPGAAAPAGSRATDEVARRFLARYLHDDALQRVQGLVREAEELGVAPGQLALAWCLRRAEVASVIVGARTIEQLLENVAAADLEIPAAVVRRLDERFPGPGTRDLTT